MPAHALKDSSTEKKLSASFKGSPHLHSYFPFQEQTFASRAFPTGNMHTTLSTKSQLK